MIVFRQKKYAIPALLGAARAVSVGSKAAKVAKVANTATTVGSVGNGLLGGMKSNNNEIEQ